MTAFFAFKNAKGRSQFISASDQFSNIIKFL